VCVCARARARDGQSSAGDCCALQYAMLSMCSGMVSSALCHRLDLSHPRHHTFSSTSQRFQSVTLGEANTTQSTLRPALRARVGMERKREEQLPHPRLHPQSVPQQGQRSTHSQSHSKANDQPTVHPKVSHTAKPTDPPTAASSATPTVSRTARPPDQPAAPSATPTVSRTARPPDQRPHPPLGTSSSIKRRSASGSWKASSVDMRLLNVAFDFLNAYNSDGVNGSCRGSSGSHCRSSRDKAFCTRERLTGWVNGWALHQRHHRQVQPRAMIGKRLRENEMAEGEHVVLVCMVR
jgi:hypothetical protein